MNFFFPPDREDLDLLCIRPTAAKLLVNEHNCCRIIIRFEKTLECSEKEESTRYQEPDDG